MASNTSLVNLLIGMLGNIFNVFVQIKITALKYVLLELDGNGE